MPAAPSDLPPRLAFDTSTEFMSIALAAADGSIRTHEAAGGARSSATLIPQVLALLGAAGLALRDLDAIVFGRGPGSFTGLRTACSVAQGFGYGAGVRLLPVDTLLAVAEEARARFGATRVVALLDARMDQVYAATYEWSDAGRAPAWRQRAEPRLIAPEQVELHPGEVLAGNAFEAYGDRLPTASLRHAVLPSAAAMLRLAPSLIAAGGCVAPAEAWPLYIRDKVAQTTDERAVLARAKADSAATPAGTHRP